MNYNTDQKALIALADLEVPARRGYELWDEFGDGETMFAELTKSDYAKKVLGTLFPSVEAKFGITYAEDVIAECESRGVYVLTAADDDFPSKLADMLNPSYAMFCRGNKGLFETKCISVVGTRKYTAYGEAVAKTFSKTLAKHFTVVSGLAYALTVLLTARRWTNKAAQLPYSVAASATCIRQLISPLPNALLPKADC